MFSILEQFSLASKAVFEAQLASTAAFAQAAFDSGVSVIELNVETAKSSVAAATVAANQWLSVKELRESMSLTGSQSQLAMERIGAYRRQATDLV
jgi:glycine cleavage system regulatory protein